VGAGSIRIDDQPVDTIALPDYRANVAVLREATKIFNLSLSDNIRLGRAGDGSELLDRISATGLESFLTRFPAGLDTMLGEDARQLSSGERQIVGLLRALLAEPALLIVDEGVNAIDQEMVDTAHHSLRVYAAEHAVLLISHNRWTVEIADYVYHLRDGRAVGLCAEGLQERRERGRQPFATIHRRDDPLALALES